MQRAIHDLTLELSRSCDTAGVTVKRGDTHRTLRIRLTQAGRPYAVASGCSAVFTAVKPDGSHLFNACTITDGVIYYDLTPQTTALPGELECELRLYGENEALLTSAAFLLTVADTVYQDGDESVASSGEATELTRLINEADRKISELEAVLANEVNHAVIDDSTVGGDAWSAKNIVDKLCPDFTESGAVAVCEPIEEYPLEVISKLPPKVYGTITMHQQGKNLIPFPYANSSATINGVTITNNEDGSITLNGTATGYIYHSLKPEDGINLIGAYAKTAGNGITVVNGVTLSLLNGSDEIFLVNTKNGLLYMQITKGVTVNNLTVYPQIEKGTVVTEWESPRGQKFTADLTNAPEVVDEGYYNWNTGYLHNGEGGYWHDPETGTFVAESDDGYIDRNIPALPGTNCFYSDCGDTEVKGKTSPATVIDKLTNAITALGGNI